MLLKIFAEPGFCSRYSDAVGRCFSHTPERYSLKVTFEISVTFPLFYICAEASVLKITFSVFYIMHNQFGSCSKIFDRFYINLIVLLTL